MYALVRSDRHFPKFTWLPHMPPLPGAAFGFGDPAHVALFDHFAGAGKQGRLFNAFGHATIRGW